MMTAEPSAPRRCLFGVNLPCFGGAYGHDLAPNERHPTWSARLRPMDAYEPLLFAREMGFLAVRIALCEGGEGLITRDGAIVGAHDALLESVRVIQECARLAGLRLYWSLLDGDAWKNDGDALTRDAVGVAEQTARFAECVARPIARVLDADVTLGVELLSAPDALALEVGWPAVHRYLRAAGDAICHENTRSFLSAGCSLPALAPLFAESTGLTATDVHAPEGTVDLPTTSLPCVIGVLGASYDSSTPSALAENLRVAERAGYNAAFAWRLDKVLSTGRGRERELTDAGRAVRSFLLAR